ncbi:MAG: hypothetical protein ACI9NT_000643 [Bacteroidia bacterium]
MWRLTRSFLVEGIATLLGKPANVCQKCLLPGDDIRIAGRITKSGLVHKKAYPIWRRRYLPYDGAFFYLFFAELNIAISFLPGR